MALAKRIPEPLIKDERDSRFYLTLIQGDPAVARDTRAQLICSLMGFAFLLLGVVGFFVPGLMGASIDPVYNLTHIGLGVLSIAAGLSSNPTVARSYAFIAGTVFAFLAILGFVAGVPVISSLPFLTPEMVSNMNPYVLDDTHLLALIPGKLEFGRSDHIFHSLTGLVYLVSAVVRQHPRRLAGSLT